MTRYLLAVHSSTKDWYGPEAEMQEAFARTELVNDRMRDAGAYVFAGGLKPADVATVVRQSGDEFLTTDGPYAETKEYLGGFWIIDAADLDEALDWARQATAACGGPVEVRPFDDDPARPNR
jgi:hypothetical protein